MAGSAIDLDKIASPEILEPRQVEGPHITVYVPVTFYLNTGARGSSTAIAPL
jgi:hypothetical protein